MKRFAVIGAGFWAKYQLSAWSEVDGAQCIAICDVDRDRAVKLADECSVPNVYSDPEKMLAAENVDFVDIITPPATHRPIVELAAASRINAICQKPLAENLYDAECMVRDCEEAGVTLLVHENFRWQAPLRALKTALDSGIIGDPFRARLHFCNSFPVFENQPLLAELDRFILTDVGVHILDVARFLFGEAESLYCLTQRINPTIQGEDVVTVVLKMRNGATIVNEMSYASRTKDEAFPQTYVFVEGTTGALELVKDYWLHVTTKDGTKSTQYAPPRYDWADPAYDIAHASLVPCNKNLLCGIVDGTAETTGRDNLETLRLVHGSYDSAAKNEVVML